MGQTPSSPSGVLAGHRPFWMVICRAYCLARFFMDFLRCIQFSRAFFAYLVPMKKDMLNM
jgi:hypothetical protein